MKNTAIILLELHGDGRQEDLEVPLDITANDLIVALNGAYGLKMDIRNIHNCCLASEHPVALLHGNKTLEAYHIRNGSVIHITE